MNLSKTAPQLLMMSRKLSLEDVIALLERPHQEEDIDDPMEVVTQGSDNDLDAEDLGEGGFEKEYLDDNGKQK